MALLVRVFEAIRPQVIVLVAGAGVHSLLPVHRPLDEDDDDHVPEQTVSEEHHGNHFQVQRQLWRDRYTKRLGKN